jgi:hypothetical protein
MVMHYVHRSLVECLFLGVLISSNMQFIFSYYLCYQAVLPWFLFFIKRNIPASVNAHSQSSSSVRFVEKSDGKVLLADLL